jgi:hypothetical protein
VGEQLNVVRQMLDGVAGLSGALTFSSNNATSASRILMPVILPKLVVRNWRD